MRTNTMRCVGMAALAALATATTAAAQELPQPGETVRVERTDGGRVIGLYRGVTADSLRLTGGSLALAEVRDVSVRRHRSNFTRGVLIGTAAGAGVGLLHALALEDDDGDCEGICDDLEDGFQGAIVAGWATLGLVTGAIAGGVTSSPRWVPAALPAAGPRARLEVAPAADGAVRVGVSVRFD